VKRAGPTLGYRKFADAIVQKMHPVISTRQIPRCAATSWRFDPAASAAMAGAYAKENAAALAGGLGRKPSDGELYIAHARRRRGCQVDRARNLNPSYNFARGRDHRFVESSVKESDCWNRMASDVAVAVGSTVPSI